MTTTLRLEIFSADLEAAAYFYVQVLGFSVARDGRHEFIPYLAFERGQVHVGAAQRPTPQENDARKPPVGVELVLEVDDLQAERKHIAEAGWPVTDEIADQYWGLRDFRLLDPDGYYWRITNRI